MAEKIETMCRECSFRQEHSLGSSVRAYRHCPYDGTPLLRVWLEDQAEIVLGRTRDDIYEGVGIHHICGGIVKEHESSDHKIVYACEKCFWRWKSLE